MKKEEIYSKILGCGVTTYYNWKREDDRPMLKLLEKYFTDDDLIEFLETDEIQKFKLIEDFESNKEKYILKIKEIIHGLWHKTIEDCGGSLEDLDSSCAVPYVNIFTEYLHTCMDINDKTYNEFILNQAAEYGAKKHEISISFEQSIEDSNDIESQIYNDNLSYQYHVNELLLRAITGVSQIISNLDNEHIIQLQMLIKSDFYLIMSNYTSKQELKDFWLDFWIDWVCEKYNYRSRKKITNIIKDQDIKKIDYKHIIQKIKNNEI